MAKPKLNPNPEKIRGADALFSMPSVTDEGSRLLPLHKIDKPTKQPRRYFDSQKMELLATSVKEKGVLEPLLVRPKGDRYELVAGERRYRAAQKVGLGEVRCVIQEMTDEEALEIALLENLQREDLNPIEETEGILELLSVRLNQPQDETIALLNQAANPHRESVHNVMHSSREWKIVEELFTSMGRFTPNSFRANRLPLLKLPETVLNALRQGQIEYTKAKAIARVKDAKQRKVLLEKAIEDGLSLSEIKKRVKVLKSSARSDKGEDEQTTPSLRDRFSQASTKLKKSKVWDDPKKRKQLDKLLKNLEALLEVNE